jgi:hypothetical protein
MHETYYLKYLKEKILETEAQMEKLTQFFWKYELHSSRSG